MPSYPGKMLSFVGLAWLVLFGRRRLHPPTPPLLLNVTAGKGGWWNGGCPPTGFMAEVVQHTDTQEASSPELAQRLTEQFPSGSEASKLEQALREQKFSLLPPREDDVSIRRAIFHQSGGGFLGPYPIHATVAWKESNDGLILWTKGHVAFTGP